MYKDKSAKNLQFRKKKLKQYLLDSFFFFPLPHQQPGYKFVNMIHMGANLRYYLKKVSECVGSDSPQILGMHSFHHCCEQVFYCKLHMEQGYARFMADTPSNDRVHTFVCCSTSQIL